MKRDQSWFTVFSAAIGFGLMVVAWITFAPVQFGGQAAYVIVTGNSMEPVFHRGDLVILRKASDYQIGDIATYRHPDIGPVIHRIVALEGSRFVFKGDNNTWVDSYQPVQAELIGKFWLYVPFAGKIMGLLRTPWSIALLVAVAGGIGMTSARGSQARRRELRRGSQSARERVVFVNVLRDSKTDLFFVLAMLALASFLLALFAFTRPLSRTISEEISYQQTGVFSYSAAAPPGLYDTDTVKTGDPIYRRLITRVNVSFDYRLLATQPHDLRGTYRLVAELGTSSSWQWDLELQPETTFSGNAFSASSVVDLSRVQAVIDNLERQTGVSPQQYTLAIVPTVIVSGTLAGQELRDQFSPRLVFFLDALQMQLASDKGRASDASNPLKPTQTGLQKRDREVTNTISLVGLSLAVSTARPVSLIGLGLSLIGIAGLGVSTLRAAQMDEASRIRSKYGSLLVAVCGSDLEAGKHIIQVAAINDLAKIAERTGRMILHEERGPTHYYFVQDSDVTYCYQSASADDKPSAAGEDGKR
jgi:signal peptidase I